MTTKAKLRGLRTVAKYAAVHAVVTAAVWLGPLTYAALGLGFKDKDKWSVLDHVVSATALPVANILTTPGRYISWDGVGGFLIPALITSFGWGVLIAATIGISRRLWQMRRPLC